MFNRTETSYLLALETAIGVGSVSILDGQREVDFVLGNEALSRSSEVLEKIEGLLRRNNINKSEIKLIAVSKGPGSLTGVRIGLAVTKGLADGIGVNHIEVSILSAMTWQSKQLRKKDKILTAVYLGRDEVCYQMFVENQAPNSNSKKESVTCHISEFQTRMFEKYFPDGFSFIFTKELVMVLETRCSREILDNNVGINISEENLAKFVGFEAIKFEDQV